MGKYTPEKKGEIVKNIDAIPEAPAYDLTITAIAIPNVAEINEPARKYNPKNGESLMGVPMKTAIPNTNKAPNKATKIDGIVNT